MMRKQLETIVEHADGILRTLMACHWGRNLSPGASCVQYKIPSSAAKHVVFPARFFFRSNLWQTVLLVFTSPFPGIRRARRAKIQRRSCLFYTGGPQTLKCGGSRLREGRSGGASARTCLQLRRFASML